MRLFLYLEKCYIKSAISPKINHKTYCNLQFVCYLCDMDFRITYEYGVHKDKETIVKNSMNEMHAKIKLNEYCKKKYGAGELRVFTCVNDDIFSAFGNIFGGFNK